MSKFVVSLKCVNTGKNCSVEFLWIYTLWNLSELKLLETCAFPSLGERRTKLKLCQLYNVLHGHSYFPQILFTSPLATPLRHIVWFSDSLLHTPIHFHIHLYLIPFPCGTTSLQSKYLLPHYKLLRGYFSINVLPFHTCHFMGMLHISILLLHILLHIARIVIGKLHTK